jgi:hypothetical protein
LRVSSSIERRASLHIDALEEANTKTAADEQLVSSLQGAKASQASALGAVGLNWLDTVTRVHPQV